MKIIKNNNPKAGGEVLKSPPSWHFPLNVDIISQNVFSPRLRIPNICSVLFEVAACHSVVDIKKALTLNLSFCSCLQRPWSRSDDFHRGTMFFRKASFEKKVSVLEIQDEPKYTAQWANWIQCTPVVGHYGKPPHLVKDCLQWRFQSLAQVILSLEIFLSHFQKNWARQEYLASI